jgi:hypothetical protein
MSAYPRIAPVSHRVTVRLGGRFFGRSIFFWAAVCTVLSGLWVCRAQSTGVAEYEIKATFLYDFAKFVDWPPKAVSSERAPFILCIVGADPFGNMLDSSVRGQRIDQHQIVIRRVSRSEDLTICQIAFISRAENKYLPAILDGLRGSSTLVVGDSQDFAKRGGGIQLYLEDKAVHFSINVDSVQRAHLAISSNVLELAKIVHDGPTIRAN